MENMIQWAVGLLVLIALVTGAIITTVHNANTTGWSTSEIAMWSVVGIVVIAMVIVYVSKGGK